MLIDARQLPADVVIEADVCIVGSGPAGLSLAREFIGSGVRVCLLESGGLEENDAELASLSAVETANDFLQVKPDSRGRQFGGNSIYWAIALPDGGVGLRHRPLDEIDFEQRDWIPYSGWPFDRNHLMPYYERAQKAFGMGPFAYEGTDWEDANHPRLPFVGDRIATRMFQFSRGTVFFEDYRDEIRQSSTITTYLHATVAELETDDTGATVTRPGWLASMAVSSGWRPSSSSWPRAAWRALSCCCCRIG